MTNNILQEELVTDSIYWSKNIQLLLITYSSHY